MHIAIETEFGEEVLSLLDLHLHELAQGSPPESMHALPIDKLKAKEVTFWCMWHHHSDAAGLMGFAALKRLSERHGELKSMRTHTDYLRSGVASSLLLEILLHAKRTGLGRISLETGSATAFAPAQSLYNRHGFELCAPFGDYTEDPNSVFMTLDLLAQRK